jgi:nucleoside-diphosphate-sugar epimerase
VLRGDLDDLDTLRAGATTSDGVHPPRVHPRLHAVRDFRPGRAANARAAAGMAARGVRSSVVRLPRTVHGEGDHHGFIARLIDIARNKGVSGYIGDGSCRWPAVHILDAAHLFRLAAEQAPAGSVPHAVADEGVPVRDIAAVIGRHLIVPTAPVAAEDSGFLGMILAVDQPASSALTRELLG